MCVCVSVQILYYDYAGNRAVRYDAIMDTGANFREIKTWVKVSNKAKQCQLRSPMCSPLLVARCWWLVARCVWVAGEHWAGA